MSLNLSPEDRAEYERRCAINTAAKEAATAAGDTKGAKNKANKVAIRLVGDLYSVKFYSLRGVNVTERGEFEMIYGDRLAALFTEQTGFDIGGHTEPRQGLPRLLEGHRGRRVYERGVFGCGAIFFDLSAHVKLNFGEHVSQHACRNRSQGFDIVVVTIESIKRLS